jgi:serine/threonine-protein kinase RsbW
MSTGNPQPDLKPKIEKKSFEEKKWTLDTRIPLIEGVEEEVEAILRKLGWNEDDILKIRISFREAMVNAMKHGNKMDPSKKVEVDVKISAKELYFRVKNEGEGFDPNSIPDPLAPENILKDSGRGVLMMRDTFDSVSYEDNARVIILEKVKK